ncbi:DUF5077 domain-containing protein [Mucilaginibacter sp. UR6-11]|uniref:DUF3472 domain-containing protein n=1 Tax=Mucilaginibacter sp. UR6-11 TaxID=1435644 RepID=UPI001E5B2D7E|nr:DUF5077 domain-containing protein [Mucilaginibacter sp. UR6-11]MCC8424791.1 DUF5077 domain-containing protein [Mucilaginibacter sp. UR6-11]
MANCNLRADTALVLTGIAGNFISRVLLTAIFLVGSLGAVSAAQQFIDSTVTIPLGGNSWLAPNAKASITDEGLTNWYNSDDVVSIYFRAEATGNLNISLKLRVNSGSSGIGVNVLNNNLIRSVSNTEFQTVNFGSITVKEPGYIKVELRGLSRTGPVFAGISDLVLAGPALKNGAAYVKNNQGNYFYWGRRGPSVHLNYVVPAEAKNTTEWFYNEVTVPVGQDVTGSYFMADGFSGGYFGMQVNSATERRILFSVWSPYATDDPKSIPGNLKIQRLKKGSKVHSGEFGGEGSGGQSYMIYPWVAGQTYCFLIHAQGDIAAETTIYTAYFKPLKSAGWQLLASFKRPQSGSYLKGLHSFLENFDPERGDKSRSVSFGNQWIVDIDGKWYPLNEALFTGDATAKINYRKDYNGSVAGSLFYLRNGGFFNDFTPLLTPLTRSVTGNPHPQIDFTSLP